MRYIIQTHIYMLLLMNIHNVNSKVFKKALKCNVCKQRTPLHIFETYSGETFTGKWFNTIIAAIYSSAYNGFNP